MTAVIDMRNIWHYTKGSCMNMRESERPGKVIEYLMLAGNVFLGLVVLELIVQMPRSCFRPRKNRCWHFYVCL